MAFDIAVCSGVYNRLTVTFVNYYGRGLIGQNLLLLKLMYIDHLSVQAEHSYMNH